MKPGRYLRGCNTQVKLMNIDRSYFLDLAANGMRTPLGTDLVLHEHPDAKAITLDGPRLGRVMAEAAARYRTPLAIPQMDLTREKSALMDMLGIADANHDFHFQAPLDDAALSRFEVGLHGNLNPLMRAHVQSVQYIVADRPELVPVGMAIGPFSLLTKLLADPITPVFEAGAGATATDEPEVALLEQLLEISTRLVLRTIELQIAAGAKLMVIAEPAANKVYFSPVQMATGSDAFQRYAIAPNRRIAKLLADAKVELMFHCCGELVEPMLRAFGTLHPTVLSLGSSRKLWEDAACVPASTILYGNLPSKQFYSDKLISTDDVARRSLELLGRMREVAHPFILGSECDVLHVPGCEHSIRGKVHAMMQCDCNF